MELDLTNKTGKKEDKPGMHIYFRSLYSKEYKATLGYETKLYLVDEQEGILTPENYMAVAEISEQCVKLVQWQVEAICRLMEGFDKKDIQYDWISVDASVTAMGKSDFADIILERINENKVKPDKFAIALPVNILEQQSNNIKENIAKLKENGVSIIIKGYGVMYSAVMDLCKIDADYCIIDESFAGYINGTEKEHLMYENLAKMITDMGIIPITDGLDTKKTADCWLEQSSVNIGIGNKMGKWFEEDKLDVNRRKVRYGELDR